MMNEIRLYGTVGESFWGEEYFTLSWVRKQLDDMEGDIVVRINSGGGIASEGLAIHHALKGHDGRVTVIVEGAAASAASLIAMAGDEIVMKRGAFLLIHDPAQWFVDGRGTEDEHRALADQLGRVSMGYAKVYAARADMTVEEAREIMRKETLLMDDEAVAMGFADRVDDGEAEKAAAFDWRIYSHVPDAVREEFERSGPVPSKAAITAMIAGHARKRKEEEGKMPDPRNAAVQEAAKQARVDGATEAKGNATGPAVEPSRDAVMAERRRATAIMQIATIAGDVEMGRKLIQDGVSLEEATDILAAKRAERDEDIGDARPARTAVIADARDRFREGAELAVMARAGLGGERNEFSSLSLSELARMSIEVTGQSARFRDRLDMVGHAFTMAGAHGTSDFANILSNVMGKAVLKGWEEAEETFQQWTNKGTLTDFKPTKRVGLGVIEALPALEEGAEYTYGTVDDRGEEIALATYGRIIRITRHAIINDDLSLLSTLPMRLGRAAKRTIGNLVYAVLTSNPTMSDGTALFHANHNNLLTGATSALSVDSLSTARARMRTQKDKSAALNIRPAYLIVPAALETAAEQIMNSVVDPRDNKGHAKNPVAGMAKVIADARLDDASSTAWFLSASPGAFDTIEVAYLDGVDRPYIEQQQTWTSDGVELKVRIDAGVAPLEWRTLLKSAGA